MHLCQVPDIPCLPCNRMHNLPPDVVVKKTFYTCSKCSTLHHHRNQSVYIQQTVYTPEQLQNILPAAMLSRQCPKCENPGAVFYSNIDALLEARVLQFAVCSNRYCKKFYRIYY